MTRPIVRRAFADTPDGQIHYAQCGSGRPVLLLHQTPRSWDEYRDVLPLLGDRYRALAMDTIGFGDSYRFEGAASIERYAVGVLQFLDALGLERVSLVGHHTGGCIAAEVAAVHPERVEKLVLSSTPYVDAEDRELRKTRTPIDEVEPSEDGSHLTALWQKRMPFYPKGRPDLLTRFVRDALTVWDHLEQGHNCCNAYRMEDKTPLIQAPTLVLAGTEDWSSYPRTMPLARSIRGASVVEIQGGMVPLPDQLPREFAAAVAEFLG